MRFAKRNWGWWFVLWKERRFKVKILYVKPDEALSMQRHKFRNELWLFIFGCGFMENKAPLQRNSFLRRGEFKLIYQNIWHRYKAKTKTLVLEIQYGDKCDETDIERDNENI